MKTIMKTSETESKAKGMMVGSISEVCSQEGVRHISHLDSNHYMPRWTRPSFRNSNSGYQKGELNMLNKKDRTKDK